VEGEEDLEDLAVADLRRVERHLHGLGVPRRPVQTS